MMDLLILYRVVRRRRDDAHGRAVCGRRERVERSLEELRGSRPGDEVVPVDHGVADEAVEASHLALKPGLDEPAEAAEVGEVAHRLPSGDHDRRAVARPVPELLVQGRVAAARTQSEYRNKRSPRVQYPTCMDRDILNYSSQIETDGLVKTTTENGRKEIDG